MIVAIPKLAEDVELKVKKKLLYVVPDSWPTFRADIVVLFGKWLPTYGIQSDLLTEVDGQPGEEISWPGGKVHGWKSAKHRAMYHIVKLFKSVRTVLRLPRGEYDAVQVRNMPVHAALILPLARWKGMRFFYWMSFPTHEGQLVSARSRGVKAGFRYLFPLIQGITGRWLLFRFVFRRADHIFVQSPTMQEELLREGVLRDRITPIPMGVDVERACAGKIERAKDPRLDVKHVLVYLGTLDEARQLEKLFEMLALVRAGEPDTVLVLVGDAHDQHQVRWLRSEAERWSVSSAVVWTGWLPTEVGWSYVRAAKIGLSPFPRGPLLDSASPTKAIEYLALGVPVVVNDNPDQEALVRECGAGICVPYEPEAFAAAVLTMLRDDALREEMANRGRRYVEANRDYRLLSKTLAGKYLELLETAAKQPR